MHTSYTFAKGKLFVIASVGRRVYGSSCHAAAESSRRGTGILIGIVKV